MHACVCVVGRVQFQAQIALSSIEIEEFGLQMFNVPQLLPNQLTSTTPMVGGGVQPSLDLAAQLGVSPVELSYSLSAPVIYTKQPGSIDQTTGELAERPSPYRGVGVFRDVGAPTLSTPPP